MDIFIIEEGRKVTQDSELTTNCDENGRELSRDLLDNKRMQQAQIFTEKILILRNETEDLVQHAFSNNMSF
jgi:hypothetical protein